MNRWPGFPRPSSPRQSFDTAATTKCIGEEIMVPIMGLNWGPATSSAGFCPAECEEDDQKPQSISRWAHRDGGAGSHTSIDRHLYPFHYPFRVRERGNSPNIRKKEQLVGARKTR